MSGNRQFVDTNILVYAHDVTAGDKHSRARALVEELWDTRQGCLSVQVLQEFFVTTTRKIPKPLEAPAAAQIIDDLAHWHVHAPADTDVRAAIDIRRGGWPGLRRRRSPQPVPGLTARASCQRRAHLAGCACLGGSDGAAQVGRVVFPAGDQVGAGFTY